MKKEKAQRSWMNNAIEYAKSGAILPCPFCGSTNVECYVLEIGHGSVNFQCHDCGKAEHIDGSPTFILFEELDDVAADGVFMVPVPDEELEKIHNSEFFRERRRRLGKEDIQ